MTCPLVKLVEIYETPHGSVRQCNRQNCYWLSFSGMDIAFRVNDFLTFKRQVDRFDMYRMLSDTSPASDCVLLTPPGTQRFMLCTVQDLIRLRELLDGARFVIELNSVVHECLSTPLQFRVDRDAVA